MQENHNEPVSYAYVSGTYVHIKGTTYKRVAKLINYECNYGENLRVVCVCVFINYPKFN